KRKPWLLGSITLVLALAACGGEEEKSRSEMSVAERLEADTEGMALPDVQTACKRRGVACSVKGEDVAFGVLVPENFQVCDVEVTGGRRVTLHAYKHGCP
ncbi:MAG: hypothetical protein M3327_11810, partial [Actinomycetota bacterium]|nr:hypothetical protein [Actinomycetota bacterium]